MKRMISSILVLVVCLSVLAACGKQEETPSEPSGVSNVSEVSEVSEESEGGVAGMENPVKSYTGIDEQIKGVHIGLEAPEGATDVIYRSIKDLAETVFKLDGVTYSYRAQATDEKKAVDISGLFYNMKKSKASVQGRDATVIMCEEAGAVLWLDIAPGITYSLSSIPAVDSKVLVDLANDIFVPVQKNA